MDKVIGLIAAITAIVIGAILYKQRKKEDYEYEKFDYLTSDIIIEWFRREDIRHLLQENKNLKAVVLRGEELKKFLSDIDKSDNYIFQCVYDSLSSSIKKGRLIKFANISDDLLKLFGNKSMIIFE